MMYCLSVWHWVQHDEAPDLTRMSVAAVNDVPQYNCIIVSFVLGRID
jgi:hypothetical protein